MKALLSNHSIVTRFLNLGLGKSIGRGVGLKEIPVPPISDDEILVKVRAVALNPTDYKHIDVISPPNSIIGCDYAGEVASVGKNALGGWKVGDRVAGAVHGGLYPDRGAFAEYLKVPGDLAWKPPADMADVEAATYGISAVTAMLALNVRLGIPWATEGKVVDAASGNGAVILVYAGSTSVGLFSIQLAKAAGYTVVTTASPRSFDLVKKYGADKVFDYHSSTAADDIINEFPIITYAVDCFSEGNSTEFCAKVLRNTGGKVVTLLDRGKSKTPGVQYELIMAYTLFGHAFQWLPPIGPKFEARISDRKALARFYGSLPRLTEVVKPPPVSAIDGGFDGILAGLDQLRNGQVSGKKLVVRL
ncbi:Protein TOXD 3 [Colletotrichum chlorophyti]|uniref:Protein TOXD 3 n=1 Tax=Colletotrichum chlorophyti TaxID=708187 RepID=A0A1Q8RLR9_9PEZI|nr:Protein TOXD 3 [Colletotrichum chlorophyti]